MENGARQIGAAENQKWREYSMDEKNRIENRIGVLDGIRAIAIGMVVWFHFWQQTWLTPYLRIPTEYNKIYWTHGDQPSWMGQIWIRFCGYDDPAQRILQFLSLCQIYCSGRGLAGYEEILQKEGSKNYCLLTILC